MWEYCGTKMWEYCVTFYPMSSIQGNFYLIFFLKFLIILGLYKKMVEVERTPSPTGIEPPIMMIFYIKSNVYNISCKFVLNHLTWLSVTKMSHKVWLYNNSLSKYFQSKSPHIEKQTDWWYILGSPKTTYRKPSETHTHHPLNPSSFFS